MGGFRCDIYHPERGTQTNFSFWVDSAIQVDLRKRLRRAFARLVVFFVFMLFLRSFPSPQKIIEYAWVPPKMHRKQISGGLICLWNQETWFIKWGHRRGVVPRCNCYYNIIRCNASMDTKKSHSWNSFFPNHGGEDAIQMLTAHPCMLGGGRIP